MFNKSLALRLSAVCSLLTVEAAGAAQQLYRCPQQDGTYLFTTERCAAAECVVAGSYHAADSSTCAANMVTLKEVTEEALVAVRQRARDAEKLEARRTAQRRVQLVAAT